MRFTSAISRLSSVICYDHFDAVRTKESDMRANTTRNLGCPEAGGLEVTETQILGTEVARMVRATNQAGDGT